MVLQPDALPGRPVKRLRLFQLHEGDVETIIPLEMAHLLAVRVEHLGSVSREGTCKALIAYSGHAHQWTADLGYLESRLDSQERQNWIGHPSRLGPPFVRDFLTVAHDKALATATAGGSSNLMLWGIFGVHDVSAYTACAKSRSMSRHCSTVRMASSSLLVVIGSTGASGLLSRSLIGLMV